MSREPDVVPLRRVIRKERAELSKRRESAGLGETPPAEIKDQIVGLAVSGGGVRSACFGMGFTQALHACGIWKWVDYLSTVSGGGYLGAYISTATLHEGEQEGHASFPLAERPGHRQPPAVLRLIFGGNYLLSGWELANKYLIGFLLINLSIFSALIAMGALIAMIWRSFDFHAFRERADMLDLNVDLYAAFWPSAVFLVAWLCSWTLSYYRRGAEAPGTVARGLLYATAASFIIGIALLLGNGDIALPQWLGDPMHGRRGIWSTLVALVLGSLLPLLQPRRLLQSGLNPKHQWERWMFAIATTAMLAGVPIAIIGTLGRENISRYSDAPNRAILRHDIDDSHAFSLLFAPETEITAAGSDEEFEVQPPSNLLWLVADADEQSAIPNLSASWERFQKSQQAFKDTGETNLYWIDHYADRMYQLAGMALPWAEENQQSEAAAYWAAKQNWQADMEAACKLLDEQLLGEVSLLNRLVLLSPPPNPVATESKEGASAVARSRADEALLRRVKSDPGSLATHEVKRANRLLLEDHYPHIFRKRSEVRRAVVIDQDQKWRFYVFALATVVFLCTGAWVDLNATSMHGYYRNRLARAFVVPKSDKSRSVELSELNTVDYGAPYHLISASAGWFERQLESSEPARSSNEPRTSVAARGAERLRSPRWVDSFLFSRRFCGCEATGYRPTKEYEGRVRGDLNRIDVAEAVALSGGAVSPGHVHNPFIAFLMFGLNLRLGQWLPNPRGAKPVARPTVLQLLLSLRKPPQDRRYCFISDGGHCENLGLLALLRRRCRLIIAVDAGQDPDHCFDDLARVLRDARIHEGIDVAPLRPEDQDWLDASALIPKKGESDLPVCKKHFLIARVLYPDGFQGLLVYAKPSMDGDEPIDLLQYRSRNKEFPHESTSDQMFDPAQVESYRQLGYHIGWRLFGKLPAASSVEELVAAIEHVHGARPTPVSAVLSPTTVETGVRVIASHAAATSGLPSSGDSPDSTFENGDPATRPKKPR